MKILITTSSFGILDKSPLDKLRHEGFEIVMNPYGRKLSQQEALKLYTPEIDGVIAGTEEISAEIIAQAKQLKIISRVGIGIDSIDFKAVQERGIKVYKTVEPVVEAVAELTVGLLLSFLRGIVLADQKVRNNKWEKHMGSLLGGKKIGIVGLGNIGRRVVGLLAGFDVEFIAHDIIKNNQFAKKYRVKYTDLDSLLSQADIVSLHIPFSEKVKGLIDSRGLNLMKTSAILINTSRGGIVDEKALVDALIQKKIAGAILDVFEKEPYSGPLVELDNVLLTPHIGSYTRESRVKMELEAVENLIKGLKEKKI